MMDYIYKFDLKYIDSSYNDYWKMAVNQDWKTWNALFTNEIQFRESHLKNLVFSIEGEQGEGKSAGLLRLDEIIANIYNTKFYLKYVHFFQEHIEQDLSSAKPRTVHSLDEQPRMYGIMANMIQDQLANYEDTFRKPQISIGYAAPSLRKHEHFFIFEALGDIELNRKGFPDNVELMLKTKRKSDKMIMPRGIIKLKWPNKELWDKYNEKKDKAINLMKNKKGGVMDQIDKDAEKVIKEYGESLYRYLKSGDRLPVSKEALNYYIVKVVGMRSYTMKGYDLLREAVKQKL